MDLTPEQFEKASEVVDSTIRMNNYDFEKNLRSEIDNFYTNLDMKVLNNRKKVHDFLSHMSSLYLNIILNGQDVYLLAEKEEDLAQKGREIIVEYLTKFRTEGL